MDIQKVRETVTALPLTDAGRALIGPWVESLPATRGEGVRTWMQSHNGQTVDTLQVRTDGSRPWVAQGRTVHARASLVEFDGSSRHYAGMTAVASDDTHLVAVTDDTVILYRVA